MSSKRMLQLVALICLCFSLAITANVADKGVTLDVEADVTVEVDVQVDLDTLQDGKNRQTKLDVDVKVDAEVEVDIDVGLDDNFKGAKVDLDIDILADVDVTVDVDVYKYRDGEKQVEDIDVESKVDITTNANIDVSYLEPGNEECPEANIEIEVDVKMDVEVDLNVKLTNECPCPECVPDEESSTPEEESSCPEEESSTPEEESSTPEEESSTPEESSSDSSDSDCGCGGNIIFIFINTDSALDCKTNINLQYSKQCVGKCETISLDIKAKSNVDTTTDVDFRTNLKKGLFVDMSVENKDTVRHDVKVNVVEDCQELGTCPEGYVPREKKDEECVDNVKVTSELDMDHKNKVKVTIHRGNGPLVRVPTRFRHNQARDSK